MLTITEFQDIAIILKVCRKYRPLRQSVEHQGTNHHSSLSPAHTLERDTHHACVAGD